MQVQQQPQYQSIVLAFHCSKNAVTALGVQQERWQCCLVDARRTYHYIKVRTPMWQRQWCRVRHWQSLQFYALPDCFLEYIYRCLIHDHRRRLLPTVLLPTVYYYSTVFFSNTSTYISNLMPQKPWQCGRFCGLGLFYDSYIYHPWRANAEHRRASALCGEASWCTLRCYSDYAILGRGVFTRRIYPTWWLVL